MQRSYLSFAGNVKIVMDGQLIPEKNKTAFVFLGLEPRRFSRIHTKALKLEMLAYRLVRKELEIYQERQQDSLAETELKLRVAKQCYDWLLASDEVVKHKSPYSGLSIGLQKLDSRSAYTPLSDTVQSSSVMLHSVMNRGDVNAGVEPKFKAMLLKDPLICLFNTYPNQAQRWQCICKNNGNPEALAEIFKDQFPEYMLKLAYDELDNNDNVKPKEADLGRSSAVKRYRSIPLVGAFVLPIYKKVKSKNISELNAEAVLEVVANDVARVAGMRVQTQELYPGTLQNETMQLLLLGQWMKGAADLGGEEGVKLQGGQENYLTVPVILPQHDIEHVSDHSISRLAEFKPLLIMQADYDGIGSKGQNKMRIGNDLIGIDFGKPYKQIIANDVNRYFKFNVPNFKNYSIFDDSNLSDKIKGLLILAKLRGLPVNPRVVSSYGDAFQQQWQRTPAQGDMAVFDDYLRYFKEQRGEGDMSTSQHLANELTCHKVIQAVEIAKSNSLKSCEILLDKFKFYLTVSKPVCDVLENIERLIAGKAGTSLRSQDNHVLLRELRMMVTPVKQWFAVSNDKRGFQFEAEFVNKEAAQKAFTVLSDWMDKSDPRVIHQTHFCLSKDSKLIVQCNAQNNDMFCQLFSNAAIKQALHPEDFDLQGHYDNELKLQELLLSAAEFNVKATLSRHVDRTHALTKNSYQIQFTSITKGAFSDELLDELVKVRQGFSQDSGVMTFSFYNISTVYASLALAFSKAKAKQKEAEMKRQVALMRREWTKRFANATLSAVIATANDLIGNQAISYTVKDEHVTVIMLNQAADTVFMKMLLSLLPFTADNGHYTAALQDKHLVLFARQLSDVIGYYHDFCHLYKNTQEAYQAYAKLTLSHVTDKGEIVFDFVLQKEVSQALQVALKHALKSYYTVQGYTVAAASLLTVDLILMKTLAQFLGIQSVVDVIDGKTTPSCGKGRVGI